MTGQRVFYNPRNPGELTNLGEIWIYKAVIIWGLTITWIGLPLISIFFQEHFHCRRRDINQHGLCQTLLFASPFVLCCLIFYCVVSAFVIVVCEIIFLSPFAYFFYVSAHERFTNQCRSMFAKKAFDFILDNKSLYTSNIVPTDFLARPIAIVKVTEDKREEIDDTRYLNNQLPFFMRRKLLGERERMFRLTFVNYCFIDFFKYQENKKLIEFLENDRIIANEWSQVTLKNLREHSDHSIFGSLWDEIKEPFIEAPKEFKKELESAKNDTQSFHCLCVAHWTFMLFWVYFLLYAYFPLFILSHIFSMFFPLMSIIYFNFNIESIELLQLILTIVYLTFMFCWIISAIRCVSFYHWTTHLMPGGAWWQAISDRMSQQDINLQLKRFNVMQQCYNQRLNEKYLQQKRKDIVIEILGKDIGGLIISYWPEFDFQVWLVSCKSRMGEVALQHSLRVDRE